ncbi:unnamed protein product, partial [Closterium sp. NIES-53]
SLPPLLPLPTPPCLPCVEGRQRVTPHSSSFPSTTAPLQTLHMDVWGPARVSGQGRERYFLLVVDDYIRYTTVIDVLIAWIHAVRLQLREQFGQVLCVLRLHSDRGGEFSSDLLREFCRGEGILQSFTLPASPQQNGIAERRIGMINLQPRVSLPQTSHTLRWTGKVGDATVFRVWGSRAFVRDTSADKLSARAIPCVFLGFSLDAPGGQFYHPTSRRVFPSQDVRFDDSVPFYHLFPYRSAPPPPPPLFLAPGPPPVNHLPPQGPAPSPRRTAELRRTAEPRCPSACPASTSTAATTVTAATATTAPAATADSTVRSQWTTRDAVARLAVRSHLPPAKRAHFGQYKTAQSLNDAVVARYSSPATAALSRLMLPYLFPDLAAFVTVTNLTAHLRTSDACYRAALPTEFCAKNPPPMYITLYYLVTCQPDSLSSVRDHFLSLCPTELTVDLLEERLATAEKSILAVGASCGNRRTPFFEGRSELRLPQVGNAATARAKGARMVEGTAGEAVEAVEEAKGVDVGVVPGVRASVVAVEVVEAAAAVAEVAVAVVLVEVQPRSVEALVVASACSSRVPVRPRWPSSFLSGTLGVGGLG